MTHWWEDVRNAWRRLTRERGFTVVAASTLALGIAATTSLITIVDAVLVRGLPVADSERIVAITIGLLVQTSTTDPVVLAGVAVLLVCVAVGTCVAPARRALRIQPAPVLRGAE